MEQRDKQAKTPSTDSATRNETFYPGPSRIHLAAFPPKERWDNWTELDSQAWPHRKERHYSLVPTTCFNCESACGLLAYIDKATGEIQKFEGNPEHPGSRGRNCAKGPATLNQVTDPDRILYPLKRAGKRGEGKWERTTWDEALDTIAARIRKAIVEERRNEIMYHVGRPGEDGFTERILAAWGVDGHNSHTNICSSGSREGYQLWMGLDRPSPDHANAKVILLISAHLESGHYFNPHAQRVIDGKSQWREADRLRHAVVFNRHARRLLGGALSRFGSGDAAGDCELSDSKQSLQPRICADVVELERVFKFRVSSASFEFSDFESTLKELYSEYTFEFAAKESGVDAKIIEEIAKLVSTAGTQFSSHNWRSVASGVSGGWTVARCLFMINALLGAIATEGGVYPNAWNKFVPRPIYTPPHPKMWNETTWPREYPLSMHEMSFLLPHFLKDGRAKLDTYFTRVYNPVWTNPDGFSWIEMLTDARSRRLLCGAHANVE